VRRCRLGAKLCDGFDARVQGLQTLAFGHHSHCVHEVDPNDTDPDWDESPLPTAMSRLTALSSLMLHNLYWGWCPNGLPHLPQVGCGCDLHEACVRWQCATCASCYSI
jgi:hypothetical protein